MLRPVLVLLAPLLACLGLRCQQRPLFDAPLLDLEQAAATELVLDLESDGDLDAIALLNFGNAFVAPSYVVQRNDGAASWTELPPVAMPLGVANLVVHTDVNFDGLRDLVFNTNDQYVGGYGLLTFLGLAGGGFGIPTHVALPGSVYGLLAGTANGDGFGDVLAYHFDGVPSAQLTWLHGTANGTLTPGQNAPSIYAGRNAIGDLDADGVDDAFLLAAGGGDLTVLRTTATGFATLTTVSSPTIATPLQMLPFDIDADGDLDLLIPASGGLLHRLVNPGNGALVAGGIDSLGSVANGRYFHGDWDNDGLSDLLLRTWDGGSAGSYRRFYHLIRNVGGSFEVAYSRRIGVPLPVLSDAGAGLGDLDGDGNLDFVDSKGIYFGNGTLDDPEGPESSNLSDWDDDGDLDRLDGTERNDGRGVFTNAPITLPPPPGPDQSYVFVKITDFEGDGLYEYLVRRREVSFNPWPVWTFLDMRLLRETSPGVLVDVGPAAAPGVEIDGDGVFDDADDDGDVDFLNGDGVWTNDGNDFFALVGTGFGGYKPFAKGDVDGDLDQDLLARLHGSSGVQMPTSLAILYRTGPGTYTTTVLYPGTATWSSTAGILADLDDDGDLDVAGYEQTSINGARTVLFENVGGQFVSAGSLPEAGRLSSGDFDVDGVTDLAIGEVFGVVLRRRTAVGFTYEPGRRLVTSATELADLDQDGDPELCGGATLWNRRFAGSAAGWRRQYGSGSPGTGQRRPLLSVTGPIRPGLQPGIRLRAAVGGSFAFLVAGTGEQNAPSVVLPGVTSHVSGAFLILGYGLTGGAGQPGAGELDVPLSIPPAAGGAQLFLQFVTLDGGVATGWRHSNGCELVVGQ